MTQPGSSSPPNQQAMVLRECGICQSEIFPDENTTTCKSCNLSFHAECWTENLGCASYGCDQVDTLKPKEQPLAQTDWQQPIPQQLEVLPWNFVLLGLAAISLAVSALTFGVPSLLMLCLIATRIWRTRRERGGAGLVGQPILLLALVLAFVGTIAGVVISRYWNMKD